MRSCKLVSNHVAEYLCYLCGYLTWGAMFEFYDNFGSVWARSIHECLQVLQWQPRPLKAFRACVIKTRSALLKGPASNHAKHCLGLLIGLNGRVLGAFNRPLTWPGLFASPAITFSSLPLICLALPVFVSHPSIHPSIHFLLSPFSGNVYAVITHA